MNWGELADQFSCSDYAKGSDLAACCAVPEGLWAG